MHVLIMGCGNLVRHVSATLSNQGHRVVVVDEHERCPYQQNPSVPGNVLSGGDNLMENMRKGGVEHADMVIGLSWDDNRNAMAAQIASNIFNVPRTLCHVGEVSKAQVYKELGLNVLSSTRTLADTVLDGVKDAR
jgi:trk system potassium uptake protein TrkA